MNKKGIVAAGSIVVDTRYLIDAYPKKGNLTKIHYPMMTTGGLNNIVIDLARLDGTLPIKVCGLIGEDAEGNLVKETLSKYPNIDISNILARGRSTITYVMTEICSKERTFFFSHGDGGEFSIEDIDFPNLDADFFLLEYLLLLGDLDEKDEVYGTKGARVLKTAKEYGMKTIIDMVSEEKKDRYETVVRPALKYVDYYISNEIEAGGVVDDTLHDDTGILEEKMWDALNTIKEFGVSEWVVVHSPAGAYGLDCKTGVTAKVPSIKLPDGYIRGTTGAGDAFGAGMIYGAYHGMDIEKALKIGNWCAACSLGGADSNSGVVPYANYPTIKLD